MSRIIKGVNREKKAVTRDQAKGEGRVLSVVCERNRQEVAGENPKEEDKEALRDQEPSQRIRKAELCSQVSAKREQESGRSYKSNKGYRRLLAAWSFLTLLFGCGCPVLASANYGQSTANWFLEQVFWIALVIVIVAVLALAAKRNFTAALTTAVVGAIVVFFIKNPTKLEDIGNAIMNAIGI